MISSFTMRHGDMFILCTDGLTKHVSEEGIQRRMLEEPTSERASRALLADALAGGGSDNITLIVGAARAVR
jgi:serine/threonine protein phosphatase PrpC